MMKPPYPSVKDLGLPYDTTVAVVYDGPRSPAKAGETGLAATNRRAPVNSENFDIDSFDMFQYVPSPACAYEPVSEVRPPPPMPAKRGPKGKIRASGPTLAGFEESEQ